jgi:aspartyl-tRNA synthetase
MSGALETSFRSAAAGSLRASDAGRRVSLIGWVHRRRDLGGLVFVDLRDREGMVQASFDSEWSSPESLRIARGLGPEDVIRVEGMVERRLKENPELPSGEIEIRAEHLEIVSAAEPLPIPVYRSPDEELPAEDLRLQYRYLDLRRPELQKNFLLRHKAARSVRRYLDEQAFIEVETPMLTRRTPEGARDYLVPSRVHAGEFYALPQSPQIYKQLLMVSGFDRYYQIVRCLRDEDLRADRQPEFTQIDAEMSFATEEDVFRIGEGMIAALWRDAAGVDLPLPMPRLSYADAMSRYGTDKPDLRFDLEMRDVTSVLRGSDFRIFQAIAGTAQRIRGIRVSGGAAMSRRDLDELQEVARRAGAPGALWVKLGDDGYTGQFAKALDGKAGDMLRDRLGLQPGDLFVAVVGRFRYAHPDDPEAVPPPAPGEPTMEPAFAEIRGHLATRMGLIDAGSHSWLWVTDFPMFDWDAESNRLVAAHHPFTAPHPYDARALLHATEGDQPLTADGATTLFGAGLRSRAYDAVYNGHEMASGSVRIHEPELQRAVFRALGIGADEARDKFGFLLEAFRYGAPPHAGIAFGFDRLVMLLAGATSLRDVIAFPKTTSGRALFEGAPAAASAAELEDLHIRVIENDRQTSVKTITGA